MKIALSILLGISVLLNIFLAGCCYFSRQTPEQTVSYNGLILDDGQFSKLKTREDDYPEWEIIEQYHLFIRNVKGKRLVVVEK